MTRHFFRKSLRKSDHRKTRSKGSAPHSYGRTGPSPAATAFHWKRRRRRGIRPKVKPVNAMRRAAPVKNGPCWNRSFTRFSPVISGRSCTSTPCASGKAAPTIRGETAATSGSTPTSWRWSRWTRHGGNTSKPAGTPAAAPASGSGRLKSKKCSPSPISENASFRPSATRLGRTRGISSPRPSPTTGWNRSSGCFQPCTASGLSCSIPKIRRKAKSCSPHRKSRMPTGNPLIASPKKTEISTNSLSWFPSTSKPGRCEDTERRFGSAGSLRKRKRQARRRIRSAVKAQQPCAAVDRLPVLSIR